ncbi:MAG: hypothetical protein CW716_05870 [Candidatus Bathyarchaeum sp.]|nr:MAG: hypothetical protein CW716_05870 [Candidatus Bathyarchaeum sp.]
MERFALNARSVSLIAVFAALAIILNAVRIPTFYHPGFFYALYEIPILVAFMIYGFKIGFLIEIIHIIGQEIFFPMGPGGIVVYPMGIIVHLFMFSGIFLASRLIKRKIASGQNLNEKKKSFLSTVFATVFRGGLMPIIDYAVIYSILLPLALGRSIPEAYILSLVPAFIIYNITSTLYAVPTAYLIARKTNNYLKLKAKFLVN